MPREARGERERSLCGARGVWSLGASASSLSTGGRSKSHSIPQSTRLTATSVFLHSTENQIYCAALGEESYRKAMQEVHERDEERSPGFEDCDDQFEKSRQISATKSPRDCFLSLCQYRLQNTPGLLRAMPSGSNKLFRTACIPRDFVD